MKKISLYSSEEKLIYFFLKKNKIYLKLVNDLLNIIFKKKDINFSYIYLINKLKIETSIKNKNNVNFFNLNNNSYIKIVFYSKNKLGILSTNNININKIIKILNESINLIKYSLEDKFLNAPDYNLIAFDIKNLKLFYPIKDNLEKRFETMNFIENNINNIINNNFIKIENLYFNSDYKSIIFGNTYNVLQTYNTSYHQIFCEIKSKKNNNMNIKYDFINSRTNNLLDNINNFGIKCAKESFIELNSIKIKSTISSIIFRNDVSINLFYDLSQSICGKNVYLKSTYLLNYINKLIFPFWLNIIEDPNIIKGLGSAPFDEEGIKTYKKFIIKNGILKNWLLDNYSSKKLKLKNTGNSGGIYNWKFIIKNENITFENLIKKMNTGFLITNLLGNGLNIYTGDYSQGVSGFWIENGNIKYPVNEVIISGNMINIFKNIIQMSNDYELRSNINCGSILIENVKISGI